MPDFRSLLALLLVGTCPAQEAKRPSLYLQALQRAVTAAQQKAVQGVDIHVDHSTWDNAWEAKSVHFIVRTTRSYGEGMKMALGLGQMLLHMQKALGTDSVPAQPLRVFVLPDRDAYNKFGSDHGAEHSSFYGSFHATAAPEQPVAAVWDANPTVLNMQVTHSVMHWYVAHAFPSPPPTWVDEGLAVYLSIHWDYTWGLAEFERLKKNGQLLPLPQVMRDGIAAYTLDTHSRFIQLGMLFYYLLRFRDDTRTTQPGESEQRAPFRDWLTALRTGGTQNADVVKLLADPAKLESELLAFEFPRS